MMCPPDHKHGRTGTCYVAHKCRCDDCRAGRARAAARRRRLKAYGRFDWDSRFTDAAPVRAHIRQLMDAGMGWKQIARAAGVGHSAIEQLIYGRKGSRGDPRKGEVLKRVLKSKADKIMAVEATLDTMAAGATVDAHQTRLLVQSLAVIGWSLSEIAHRVGAAPQNFHESLGRDQVSVATARKVRGVWRDLCMTPRVGTDRHVQASITRTKNAAKKNGWLSPLGLDDLDVADVQVDDVDEVAVELAMRGERVRLTPAERVEAVHRLTVQGVGVTRIAARLHMTDRTVCRLREEEAA